MAVKYSKRVWRDKKLKGGKLLVMLALADHATEEGDSWPGMPLLTDKTRLTDRQIRRVLNTLAEDGYITIEERAVGRGKRPHYKLFPNEKADILSDQNEEKADISDNKSGHFVHEKADISDTNQSHVRREPITEPPIEPEKGKRTYAPSPSNFGIEQRQPRREQQFVNGITEQYRELGLSPPEFRQLVDSILDGMRKRRLAELDTRQGIAELSRAQECALALAKEGYRSPPQVSSLFESYRIYDWRGKKGELPSYELLVTHIAELPDLIAASRENGNGSYRKNSTANSGQDDRGNSDEYDPEIQRRMDEHRAKRKSEGSPYYQ